MYQSILGTHPLKRNGKKVKRGGRGGVEGEEEILEGERRFKAQKTGLWSGV